MRTCVWPDEPCDREVKARGLCTKHWTRAKAQGRLDEFPAWALTPPGPCEQVGPNGVCGTWGKYVAGCRGVECRAAAAARKAAERARNAPSILADFSWLVEDPPCAGKDDLFFPRLSEDIENGQRRWDVEGLNGHHARAVDPWALARTICAGCPMQDRCLEAALSYGKSNQYGFVGGADPWERRQRLKQRGRRAAA